MWAEKRERHMGVNADGYDKSAYKIAIKQDMKYMNVGISALRFADQLSAVERAAEAGQSAVQQGHRQLQGAVVQTQVVLNYSEPVHHHGPVRAVHVRKKWKIEVVV